MRTLARGPCSAQPRFNSSQRSQQQGAVKWSARRNAKATAGNVGLAWPDVGRIKPLAMNRFFRSWTLQFPSTTPFGDCSTCASRRPGDIIERLCTDERLQLSPQPKKTNGPFRQFDACNDPWRDGRRSPTEEAMFQTLSLRGPFGASFVDRYLSSNGSGIAIVKPPIAPTSFIASFPSNFRPPATSEPSLTSDDWSKRSVFGFRRFRTERLTGGASH